MVRALRGSQGKQHGLLETLARFQAGHSPLHMVRYPAAMKLHMLLLVLSDLGMIQG